MQRKRDPIERASDEDRDLYDVATWEPRSSLDYVAYGIYGIVGYGLPLLVGAIALLITLALLLQPSVLVLEDPLLGVFFGLSIVPAAALAAFIWYTDVTTTEPLGLLVATFVLAVLFATFAAVVNSATRPLFQALGGVGVLLFFYVIVGPVEETVKLLAVRVLAYRSRSFDAVIDGTVYGAVAGLGFAAIENTLYITGTVATTQAATVVAATDITASRALAGPGHVIYSAIAGYYLGLAKFNPRQAGPLVVKGLLVAAFAHGTYNVTVGIVQSVATSLVPGSAGFVFVGYVIAFNLAIGYYLYRKIARYRRTYAATRDDAGGSHRSELTEFDPPRR